MYCTQIRFGIYCIFPICNSLNLFFFSDPFVYSHLVFDDKHVQLDHFDYPLPNWPFISVDSLLNLCTPISDEAQQYFLRLTTGQFLCLAETAKNFEAYNYEVRNEETESCLSSWQNILKGWLQKFTKTKAEIEVKAIWALYNIFLIFFWCFNATFNNISAISWRPVVVVEEAGVPGENHRPWASNW